MSANDEVAALLEEFAMLLDAQGVDYKPRAYERAAESIRDHTADVEALAGEGADTVAEIDDVGDAISEKVVEYIEAGEIAELEELRAKLPVEIEALTSVEGVGPRTVGRLYEELGVQTLNDLEAAAEAGEIQELRGFGEKTEQNILEGIPFAREAHERQLLGEARPQGERVRDYLADNEAVSRCALAGSIRRWKPTIGDVDVLVGSDAPDVVVEAFTDYPEASTVIEAGSTKASIRVGDVRVDLRVVASREFGAALQYFTGSKDHNVAVRNRALDRGLKINEYGVFDVSELEEADDQRAGERVGGETEREMYEAVGMAWVPPELREDRGEVAAAAADDLPALVETGDVRGDLHTHTEWSDGANTIEEMAIGAADFGHEYVCITDHATGPGMVGGVGLSDTEIREQIAAIREVDEEGEIDVLAGVEANIAADGSVSVEDSVLGELDLVVASPHAGLDGDGTDRLVEAARHPEVDIIGHPTGRQLNQREGMEVDIERLGAVAAETGTALEINANPTRLDLGGRLVQRALEQGATVAVDTDAHRPSSYGLVRYGVHVARRGWAEGGDVLNTQPLSEVRSFLS
ncbi:DNA polymerase/3'-5' exonuclease PolX [Halovenus salina]|uniref:DNA polymerase/3'-5' exonuclease PolX n=1 Tax=Halovenus salina TaxID=1510225 RepID=UPI002260E827|nr:DNA polymerase/3'-5' exonuclease PolX [Halovenus salina]